MFTQTYGAPALDASHAAGAAHGLPARVGPARPSHGAGHRRRADRGRARPPLPTGRGGRRRVRGGGGELHHLLLLAGVGAGAHRRDGRAQVLFDRLVGVRQSAGPVRGGDRTRHGTPPGQHAPGIQPSGAHRRRAGPRCAPPPDWTSRSTGTLSPMRVPGFLVRQLYVAGSLVNHTGGFSLQARNNIGDGWLDGIGAIKVDGQDIPLTDISATREGDPATYRAVGRHAADTGRVPARRRGHLLDLAAGRSTRATTSWRWSCTSASWAPCPWASPSDCRTDRLDDVRRTRPGRATVDPWAASITDVIATRLSRVPPFERGLTLGDFLVPIRLGERAAIWQRNLLMVLVGTGLMILGAYISFDLPSFAIGDIYVPANPYVPVSLQTLSALVVGATLGFRRGVSATTAVPAAGCHRAAGVRAQQPGQPRFLHRQDRDRHGRSHRAGHDRRLPHRVRARGWPGRPSGRAGLGPPTAWLHRGHGPGPRGRLWSGHGLAVYRRVPGPVADAPVRPVAVPAG